MLTPRFNITQDDSFIYIEIRCPYVKASMIQFEIVNDLFVFSIPPYYLRLRLPGGLVEDEHTSCKYDIATSLVHCKISKSINGEEFKDLEMLTKLLARDTDKDQKGPKKPHIEELDSTSAVGDSDDDQELEEEEIIFDEIEQQPFDTDGFAQTAKYGFNEQYNEIIKVSQELGNDVLELPDAETSTVEERKSVSINCRQAFDVEYYWADLYENDNIQSLLEWKQPNYDIDDKEKDILLKLSIRKYILKRPKQVYLGLLQLLFAQAFEARCTEGEPNVESAWTVGKLCPMMAALDMDFETVDETMIECTVRALVYPLYRHYDLCIKTWSDVLQTLQTGRAAILQRMLTLMSWFTTEQYHVFTRIFLEDYAVFIQNASDKAIAGLVTELQKSIAGFEKSKLGLGLVEYEQLAEEVIQDAKNQHDDGDSRESS